FSFFLFSLNAQRSDDHFLVINPNGHKSNVRDIEITADGKQIVSCSFDKTVKIWDAESGEVIREMRGQIGKGSEGMVYTMSLSPDNKYLATGGWFGKDDASENLGDIRIFDFKTGKLIHVLKGHTNVIEDLQFLPDSKKLLAADATGNINLWNVSTQLIEANWNPSGGRYKMNTVAHAGNYFYSGDENGTFYRWEYGKKKPLDTDTSFRGVEVGEIIVSPDGKNVAVEGWKFVVILDDKFNVIAEIDNDLAIGSMAFSPDSKTLCLASAGGGDTNTVNFYHFVNAAIEVGDSLKFAGPTILAARFLDNEHVVLGGRNDEVILCSIGKKGTPPSFTRAFGGVGKEIWATGITERKIAYSDDWTENFGKSKFNKQFDLFYKSFEKPDAALPYTRPQTKFRSWSLERKATGIESHQLNSCLLIKNNNKIVDSVVLENWNGANHEVFGFDPKGEYIISGQEYGKFSVYDLDGNELNRFVGHEGNIHGFSFSPDGKRMISGSVDRTIRIWPANEIGKRPSKPNLSTVNEYLISLDPKLAKTYAKVFKKLGIEKEANSKTVEDWNKLIAVLKNNYYTAKVFEETLYLSTLEFIYPIASVFLTEDGEYIIWDEKGYFASSKKGSRYVGYHINQGKNKESKYYPFEQFDLKYNRPDIILKELELASLDVIDGYYKAYQKRLKKMGVSEDQLSEDIHLPELVVEEYKEEAPRLKVKLNCSDSKYKLDRINVYINDVPVYGANGLSLKAGGSSSAVQEISLELMPGHNKVQFSVLNEKGAESLKETYHSYYKNTVKPDLYIVSLGVSNYKDKNFNLNFAAKDAADFSKFFDADQEFNKVVTKTLLNEQVTLENVKKLREEVLMKTHPNDVVIFFVAGHGVLDKNLNYYFGSYDMNFEDPAQGGIAYEELEKILDGIPSLRKLFFMDSCHSGELDKDDYVAVANTSTPEKGAVTFRDAGKVSAAIKKEMGLQQASQLSKEIFADLRRGTGATVISSAGGAEYAMESKAWNNGLFTYCLLSGMKEKAADLNKDGKIMISEIQNYVYTKVSELSGGKQQPASRRENLEFDFRLW
ncbi:MAG: caspase family protein, partial [Bacteroidia bacterium]